MPQPTFRVAGLGRLGVCVWVLLLSQLAEASGKRTRISIVLKPRNYTSPRDRPDFLCGLDKSLEPQKLLAELNSPYLLNLLDNSEDPTLAYKTRIFDVAFFTARGTVYHTNQTNFAPGILSLILVPASAQCYPETFLDAKEKSRDYYVVYVGQTLPDEVVNKYEEEAPKLMYLFDDQKPKLCGTYTFMRDPVASSRVETLNTLFNFHFAAQRAFADQELACTEGIDTERSIANFDVFEHPPEGFNFTKEEDIAIETDGYLETQLSRTSTGKVGVAFLETTLQSADRSDIVPFNGPVVFNATATTSSFFTQIIEDNEPENIDEFEIALKHITPRIKRSPVRSQDGSLTEERGRTQVKTGSEMRSDDRSRTPRQKYLHTDKRDKLTQTEITRENILKVMTIPVGQGDSTMIECPNGEITMIDMGATEQAVDRATFVANVLEYIRTEVKSGTQRKLVHVFFTHPDADHINYGFSGIQQDLGLLEKLEQSDVGQTPDGKLTVHIGSKEEWGKTVKGKDAPLASRLIKYVSEEGKKNIFSLQPHDNKDTGAKEVIEICPSNRDISMTILATDLGKEKNSRSMVIKLKNKDSSMLFLGDFEEEKDGQDTPLYNKLYGQTNDGRDLKSDVIMIPHHGSGTNGNGRKELYDRVKAKHAVISSHIDSTHYHPRRKTIEAFCRNSVREFESCDVPCGYMHYGNKYSHQMPVDKNDHAYCNNGFTFWAPIRSVKADHTVQEYKKGHTFHFADMEGECQNIHGNRGSIRQTTKYSESKEGVKVEAQLLVTYLGNKNKDIHTTEVAFETKNIGEKGFKLKNDANMFSATVI